MITDSKFNTRVIINHGNASISVHTADYADIANVELLLVYKITEPLTIAPGVIEVPDCTLIRRDDEPITNIAADFINLIGAVVRGDITLDLEHDDSEIVHGQWKYFIRIYHKSDRSEISYHFKSEHMSEALKHHHGSDFPIIVFIPTFIGTRTGDIN